MTTKTDIGFDFFDFDAIARPHRFYERLRHDAPIVWSDQMQAWLLTKYEDVRAVLRDPSRFSNVRPQRSGGVQVSGRPEMHREDVAPLGTLTMLGADPPDHTRLRRLLDRDFTPAKIRAQEPHIQEITDRLLEGAAQGESFDVAEDLAVPLPVTVIAEMIGIPPELGDQFKRWSDAATEPFRPESTDEEIHARNREIVAFREYLQAQIEVRHENPSNDFIGRLVAAHDEESKLSDAEVLSSVNLLLLAGNETTTNLISNAVLAMTKFPEQQQALRDDPSLIDVAIEEFLRYDGSVQFTSRLALEPVEFQGQEIKAGEQLVVVLASANRDEDVFPDPNVLDFTRPRQRHVGFGDWIHICLGQHLARLETKCALLSLLREFPDFELAIPEDEIPYRANFNLRGPKHLPIRRVAG